MPRVILTILLCGSPAAAQYPRDSWKLKPFARETHLTHTLADAPLKSNEREQIYRVLDQNVNDSFSDPDREEQRKAVMSFRVGIIALAQNGSQQILVRGTKDFCSP